MGRAREMYRHSYGCWENGERAKKKRGARRSGRKARGCVARDFCGCVCRCMTPVLPAACHRLLPPLPNTLMLLPILTRRFLTASRNCAAIFGVNDGVDAGLRRERVVALMRRALYTRCSIRSVAPATIVGDSEG